MRCATSVDMWSMPNPPRGTHRPPLRLQHGESATSTAMRCATSSGYVSSMPTRYAAHTVRRYVCNMVTPLRGRIRVQQPLAAACAPREVPGEWRPARPCEARRESTGNRLRVASPFAPRGGLGETKGGGPPCVQHGAAPCTLPFISPGQMCGSHCDVSSCASPGWPGDRLAMGCGCSHGVVAPESVNLVEARRCEIY
jgi:hypothetical protein